MIQYIHTVFISYVYNFILNYIFLHYKFLRRPLLFWKVETLELRSNFLYNYYFLGTKNISNMTFINWMYIITMYIFRGFFRDFLGPPQKLNLELSFETQSSHQSFSAVKMKLFELNSWRVKLVFSWKPDN
jgi:hypothetical protein